MSRRSDDEDDPRQQFREGRSPGKPAPARRRDEEDEDEEERRPRRRRPDDDDYDRRPRAKNGLALAGYYLGFLGLIAILGSFALIMFLGTRGSLSPEAAGLIGLVGMYGVGGISGLLAIILGSIGAAKASKVGSGTGHAVVGIVLGALEVLGLILITVLGVAAVSGARRF
ncbi:MAG: hypothetical protein U0793_15170 [Gemmataceae bacterium]